FGPTVIPPMFTFAQLGNDAFTLGKNSLHVHRRESALLDPLIKTSVDAARGLSSGVRYPKACSALARLG
ncbi:MAG: hypothetical protein ABI455_11945, partial [Candidatus Dormiibacterota bacterium]